FIHLPLFIFLYSPSFIHLPLFTFLYSPSFIRLPLYTAQQHIESSVRQTVSTLCSGRRSYRNGTSAAPSIAYAPLAKQRCRECRTIGNTAPLPCRYPAALCADLHPSTLLQPGKLNNGPLRQYLKRRPVLAIRALQRIGT